MGMNMTDDDRLATDAPPAGAAAQTRESLLGGPAFCMAPWMHLHVLAEGQVTPCCESRQSLGNINTTRFDDIWNGAEMASVRAQMLRGERVGGCRKCYEREDSGLASPRNSFNLRHGHHFDGMVAPGSDGRAPQPRPLSWDIRF